MTPKAPPTNTRAKPQAKAPKKTTPKKAKTATPPKVRYAKYKPEIVEHFLQLVRTDTYTVAEMCRQVGISYRLYYVWREEHPEFLQALEEAHQERKEAMAQVAKQSLLRKLQGYEVQETKVVEVPSSEGEMTIRERTTTTKHIQPDTTALIFALTNTDPHNWRNRHNTEITGKDGRDLFQRMSDEELDAHIAQLQAAQQDDPSPS